MDFAGAGSFDPASGAMTISGLTGGESIIESMFYFSGTGASGCQQNTLYALSAVTGSSYQAYGAPVAQQVAGDFHATQLLVSGSNGFRMLTEYFQAMGNRTVTLGPDMPVPSIFDDSRAYKQLEASVTYPAEFNTFISFLYSTASNGVGIFATSGAFGGTSIALFLPDFSGVSGWDNSYAPGSGETVEWGLTGTGA